MRPLPCAHAAVVAPRYSPAPSVALVSYSNGVAQAIFPTPCPTRGLASPVLPPDAGQDQSVS